VATKPKAAAPAPSGRRYFIVNPKGCIHEVEREHAKWRLSIVGWRMATAAEVAELDARGGEQRADDPICTPWSPDPDSQIDVDAA
jgi:hypothetical protein